MKPKFCHVSFHARDVSSASAGFSSTAAPANPAAASSPAPARRFQPRHPSRSPSSSGGTAIHAASAPWNLHAQPAPHAAPKATHHAARPPTASAAAA